MSFAFVTTTVSPQSASSRYALRLEGGVEAGLTGFVEDRLMLAAEKKGNARRQLAQTLVLGINKMPAAGSG